MKYFPDEPAKYMWARYAVAALPLLYLIVALLYSANSAPWGRQVDPESAYCDEWSRLGSGLSDDEKRSSRHDDRSASPARKSGVRRRTDENVSRDAAGKAGKG